MKKFFGMSVFLLAVFVLASCGSDDDEPAKDTVPPTIDLTAPLTDAKFDAGTDIVLKATFADDVALAKVTCTLTSSVINAWKPAADEITLSGKSDPVDEDIFVTIPADAANGAYTLTLTLVDAANLAAVKKVPIVIEGGLDTVEPNVEVTAPTENTEFLTGTDIVLNANFTDDVALKSVTCTLASSVASAWAPAADVVTITGKSYVVNEAIFVTIPVDAAVGAYTLTLTVKDAANNTEEVSIPIAIKDGTKPVMTITNPTARTYELREFIKLSGTFTDNVGLEKLVAELALKPAATSGSLKSINIAPVKWQPEAMTITDFGGGQLTDVVLFGTEPDTNDEPTVGIPNNCEKGVYVLTLTLTDTSGNKAVETIELDINGVE